MITYKNKDVAYKDGNAYGINRVYFGLSSDTKPSFDYANGDLFIEMDTSTTYLYDADASDWIEVVIGNLALYLA